MFLEGSSMKRGIKCEKQYIAYLLPRELHVELDVI